MACSGTLATFCDPGTLCPCKPPVLGAVLACRTHWTDGSLHWRVFGCEKVAGCRKLLRHEQSEAGLCVVISLRTEPGGRSPPPFGRLSRPGQTSKTHPPKSGQTAGTQCWGNKSRKSSTSGVVAAPSLPGAFQARSGASPSTLSHVVPARKRRSPKPMVFWTSPPKTSPPYLLGCA